MFFELVLTSRFKRALKRARKRGLDIDRLNEIVDKLQNNIELEARYHDHDLHGTYQGFRECHIQPDWLLIYLRRNDVLTLTLIDTGSHSDLYDE